jgi:hypothetical protein
MGLVLRQESLCRTVEREGKKEYIEVYKVSGTEYRTRDDALQAEGIPQYNSSYERNATALCRDRDAQGSVALWTVTVVFAVPDTGTWTTVPDDPTKTPWRARIVPITDRETSDVTSDNKPVRNSAGDKFEPEPIDQYIRAMMFEVRGYFKSPDAYLEKVAKFLHTVNKDPFVLKPNAGAGGSYTIEVGRMKVVSIEAEEYELGTTKPIAGMFRLEWRPSFPAVGQPPRRHPFQKRVRNQGTNAWYRDTTSGDTRKAEIYDYNADKTKARPSATPTDLNLDGTIAGSLIASRKVGPDLLDSVAVNTQFSGSFDSDVFEGVTFLYFRECPDADFTQLFV